MGKSSNCEGKLTALGAVDADLFTTLELGALINLDHSSANDSLFGWTSSAASNSISSSEYFFFAKTNVLAVGEMSV